MRIHDKVHIRKVTVSIADLKHEYEQAATNLANAIALALPVGTHVYWVRGQGGRESRMAATVLGTPSTHFPTSIFVESARTGWRKRVDYDYVER